MSITGDELLDDSDRAFSDGWTNGVKSAWIVDMTKAAQQACCDEPNCTGISRNSINLPTVGGTSGVFIHGPEALDIHDRRNTHWNHQCYYLMSRSRETADD